VLGTFNRAYTLSQIQFIKPKTEDTKEQMRVCAQKNWLFLKAYFAELTGRATQDLRMQLESKDNNYTITIVKRDKAKEQSYFDPNALERLTARERSSPIKRCQNHNLTIDRESITMTVIEDTAAPKAEAAGPSAPTTATRARARTPATAEATSSPPVSPPSKKFRLNITYKWKSREQDEIRSIMENEPQSLSGEFDIPIYQTMQDPPNLTPR